MTNRFKKFWKAEKSEVRKDQNWIELMRNLETLLGTINMSDREKSDVLELFINYQREHPGSIDINA